MSVLFYLFFNDTATTEIYTLSLHDALPISMWKSYLLFLLSTYQITPQKTIFLFGGWCCLIRIKKERAGMTSSPFILDRKSTRLNSSHANISYAVFCLKKKEDSSE